MKPITEGNLITTLQRSVAQSQQAQHAAEQIAYHGPGPTFGALAIGECFEWPPPIPRAQSGEPLVKTAAGRYAWSRGWGTAEAFYRVERWLGTAFRDSNRAEISADRVPLPPVKS